MPRDEYSGFLVITDDERQEVERNAYEAALPRAMQNYPGDVESAHILATAYAVGQVEAYERGAQIANDERKAQLLAQAEIMRVEQAERAARLAHVNPPLDEAVAQAARLRNTERQEGHRWSPRPTSRRGDDGSSLGPEIVAMFNRGD